MKYDCSKALDYSHESNRMCETLESCAHCPLGRNCNGVISQKEIDIVQKWSDEHSEETMLEHFKKLFPNALYTTDKLPAMCPKTLGWIDDEPCIGLYCGECWNEPYEQNK